MAEEYEASLRTGKGQLMRRYIPNRSQSKKATRPFQEYTLPNGGRALGWYFKDVTSPDGKRFECANPREFSKVVSCLKEMAGMWCEGCNPRHYLGPSGDPHHVRNKKVGGGFTDDRITVNGVRQLIYACRKWHEDEHAGRNSMGKAEEVV